MRKVGFVALAIMAFAVLTVLSTQVPTVRAQTPPTPPGVEEGITPPPDLDSAQPGDPVEEGEDVEGAQDDRPVNLPDNVDTAQPGDPVEEEGGAEGQVDARPEGLPDNVDTGQQGDPVDEGGASGLAGTAPAPSNVRVISSDHDSVNLKWNAVTDADAYRVEYKKGSSTTWRLSGFVWTGTARRVRSPAWIATRPTHSELKPAATVALTRTPMVPRRALYQGRPACAWWTPRQV